MGFTLKGKNLLPRGANSFILEYTPFQNELGVHKKLSGSQKKSFPLLKMFVCVEVLRPSQPNGVMSSAVGLPNHMFTGQA